MQNGNKPKPIKSWKFLPKEGIVLVTGDIGEGKSCVVWWLAEQHHIQGGLVAAFNFTRQAQRELPTWVNKKVKTVKDLARLKAPHLIVVDEAALNSNARRSMSEENVDWTKLAAVIRHKGHLTYHLAQHNRQPDVALVAAARVAIMKRPSILHQRFSRPEMLPELKLAFDTFMSMRGDTRKKAFVVDYRNGATGVLSCHLPTFWSETLSRAFAAVDFDADNGDGLRRRPRTIRKRAGRR